MALLRSLGDQVRLVQMIEPSGIQLQDLLERPFVQRQVTRESRFENVCRAAADWQVRILDLPGCLARTYLQGEGVTFNLRLADPVERFLEDGAPWGGVGGDYVATLGPESSARPGQEASLPTLTASVGAFTRLWLGVRPATGLAVTDDLNGPSGLLEALDRVLMLPEPQPDWDF